MTSDLRTTIIGVAIIALIGFGLYLDVDRDTMLAIIGALIGGGFMLAKDAKK